MSGFVGMRFDASILPACFVVTVVLLMVRCGGGVFVGVIFIIG